MENYMVNNMENQEFKYEGNCCCYNEFVNCNESKCDKCGWNPNVYAKRIGKIKAKIKAESKESKWIMKV